MILFDIQGFKKYILAVTTVPCIEGRLFLIKYLACSEILSN